MTEGLTRLGQYRDGSVKIMTVRLGEGCREACAQCGAYPRVLSPGDLVPKDVTRDRIEACLNGEFVLEGSANGKEAVAGEVSPEGVSGETRKRLADLLANYVTTDVNQELLNSDTFLDFADLVKTLTGGRSRAICISHGLRVSDGSDGNISGDKDAVDRLDTLASRMDDKDVFVLSLDLARSAGKIGSEINLYSYAETLNRLKPALERGSRITVSVQGIDSPASPFYRILATNLYDDVKGLLRSRYNWDDRELALLTMDTGRSWVLRGRAENLPGLELDGQCPVIPDASLVINTLDKPTNAAFLDCISGRVFVVPNNEYRSYNDVARLGRFLSARGASGVKKGHWDEVYLEYPGVTDDLTGQFSPEVRLAALHSTRVARRRKKNAGSGTG